MTLLDIVAQVQAQRAIVNSLKKAEGHSVLPLDCPLDLQEFVASNREIIGVMKTLLPHAAAPHTVDWYRATIKLSWLCELHEVYKAGGSDAALLWRLAN